MDQTQNAKRERSKKGKKTHNDWMENATFVDPQNEIMKRRGPAKAKWALKKPQLIGAVGAVVAFLAFLPDAAEAALPAQPRLHALQANGKITRRYRARASKTISNPLFQRLAKRVTFATNETQDPVNSRSPHRAFGPLPCVASRAHGRAGRRRKRLCLQSLHLRA